MDAVVLFLGAFIVIYLIYFIFVLRRRKYLDKFINGKEITYLKYRYNIKVTEKNKKSLTKLVALANSLIMALTFSSVIIIMDDKNFILYLIFSMISVVVLILVIYHIIGKIYQKK